MIISIYEYDTERELFVAPWYKYSCSTGARDAYSQIEGTFAFSHLLRNAWELSLILAPE